MIMLKCISRFFSVFREQILYIVFGLLTTAINLVAYFLLRMLDVSLFEADVIAWIVAVIFSYYTNRKYVFQSAASGFRACLVEAASFVIARLISLGIDLTFLLVTVEVLHWWETGMKVISNGIVIVANYVFSKVFVFRKRK